MHPTAIARYVDDQVNVEMPIVPRLNDKLATNPWPDSKILSDKRTCRMSKNGDTHIIAVRVLDGGTFSNNIFTK